MKEFEEIETQQTAAPKGKSMSSLVKSLHRRNSGDAVALRERADPASKLGEARESVESSDILTEGDFRISSRVGGGPVRQIEDLELIPPPSLVREAHRRELREGMVDDPKAHVRRAMELFSEAIEHLAAAHDLL